MRPSREPVWVGWVATVLLYGAARYGLPLDDAQAAVLAGLLGTGVQFLVRRFVTPTARPRGADGTPLGPMLSSPTVHQPQPPPSRGLYDQEPPRQSRPLE